MDISTVLLIIKQTDIIDIGSSKPNRCQSNKFIKMSPKR